MSSVNSIPPVGHEDSNSGPNLINELNNDCLARIFQFLPLMDKFRISAVCKRWKELADLAWENTKSLDFNDFNEENRELLTDWQQLSPKVRNQEGVERVLKKCGRYLEDLDLGWELDTRMLPVLAEYCQNLTHLYIKGYYQHWINVFFPRLENLTMDGSRRGGGPVSGEFFRSLPHDKMTDIHLTTDSRKAFRRSLPHGAFSNFSKLASIRLYGFILDSDNMSSITQMTSLKVLNLWSCSLIGQLPPLTSLRNLKCLILEGITQVNDQTLIEISDTCQGLKYLTINSTSVTDRGVFYLKFLKKLKYLSVCKVSRITDAPLSHLHSLKELTCENCSGVRDEGIITLIKCASHLSLVFLEGTGVTERLVHEANEIMQKRDNGVRLVLSIDENLARNFRNKQLAPLLKLLDDRDDSDESDDTNDVDD